MVGTSNLDIFGWWFEPLWKMLVSWEGLSHILGKMKDVWNHQPVIFYVHGLKKGML